MTAIRTLVVRAGGLGLTVVAAAGLWRLQPAAAEPVALEAMRTTATVAVRDSRELVEMTPLDRDRGVAVIFYPGGLVDPRAYSAMLRPLAERGYHVLIAKMPLDLALLDASAAEGILASHPQIRTFVIGGHSLGGAAAAGFAAGAPQRFAGLFLWAAYPVADMSEVEDLQALSVAGGQDGLATPADIEASRAMLPPAARFVEVPGAAHSTFGDYGGQAGDGQPVGDPEVLQDRIVRATLLWLRSVTGQ